MEVKIICPSDFVDGLKDFEILNQDVEQTDAYYSIDPLIQQLLLDLTYEMSKKLAIYVKQYVFMKLTSITIQTENGNQITIDKETTEDTIIQFLNEE